MSVKKVLPPTLSPSLSPSTINNVDCSWTHTFKINIETEGSGGMPKCMGNLQILLIE